MQHIICTHKLHVGYLMYLSCWYVHLHTAHAPIHTNATIKYQRSHKPLLNLFCSRQPYLEDFFSPISVRPIHSHLAVKPARPQQCSVEHLLPVGGRNAHHHLLVAACRAVRGCGPLPYSTQLIPGSNTKAAPYKFASNS